MKKLYALILVVLASISCTEETDHAEKSHVLLISFDGFRYDYVEKANAENFKSFIKEGTAARWMIPSFPSKTFPNHYSIVTGLYPGNHGLVDNSFYDKTRDTVYSIRKRQLVQDAYFYSGKPLWQLVQEHGMKSASYFWVGSEAPIAGSYPDYYTYYDGSVPNEDRINQVIKWFSLSEDKRPSFVTLYFSLVDDTGHHSGPDSEDIIETVLEADRLLGLVMEGIASIALPVDVIITSDHGMYPVEGNPDHALELPELINTDNEAILTLNNGTHVHLYAAENVDVDSLYGVLQSKEVNFTTYRKEDTPLSWHYRDHPRIGDILLVANPGYKFYSDRVDPGSFENGMTGEHGYDPYTTPEMGAIFYARGPHIKEGLTIDAFEIVHIYPAVARILGISTGTIDSDINVLMPILKGLE